MLTQAALCPHWYVVQAKSAMVGGVQQYNLVQWNYLTAAF